MNPAGVQSELAVRLRSNNASNVNFDSGCEYHWNQRFVRRAELVFCETMQNRIPFRIQYRPVARRKQRLKQLPEAKCRRVAYLRQSSIERGDWRTRWCCGSLIPCYNPAMRPLPLLYLALTLAASAIAGEPVPAPSYPLWDGHEPITEYARKVNLPPTKTLDLGNGVKLELVLIPPALLLALQSGNAHARRCRTFRDTPTHSKAREAAQPY